MTTKAFAPALVLVAIFALGVSSPAQAQNRTGQSINRPLAIDRWAQVAVMVEVNRENNRTAEKINDRQATSAERQASIAACRDIIISAQQTGSSIPSSCDTPSSGVTLGYGNRSSTYSNVVRGPLNLH